MTLIRRKPFGVNSIFDDLFDNPVARTNGWGGSSYPAVNIKKDDENFEIEFAAPGMKKSDFSIEVNDGTLTVSTEKKAETTEEEKNNGNYSRREFSYTSFSRSFNLPNEIDEENIKAKYEDGILRVSIPHLKTEIKKPKLVEIQ